MNNAVAKAKLKNLHIAPRKVRLVVDVIRGMHVVSALAQLQVMTNRSAPALTKLIQSAISNAKEKDINIDNLIIGKITVDKGITLRRTLPKARGRASVIEKKMSHIDLELIEVEGKTPSFALPKKEQKIKKESSKDKKDTQKPKSETEVKDKGVERAGSMKKMFRRKSI